MTRAIALLIVAFSYSPFVATALAQNVSGLLCNPANLGEYKIELTRYEESGQYQHDIAASVRPAAAYLKEQARREGKLAIVLDIDETSLSNWPVIKADDFGFIPQGPCDLSATGLPAGACGWIDWINQARDQPILPTLRLYREARNYRMAVFFVTGRPELLRNATERNLRAAGYDRWNGLMMKSRGYRTESVIAFKTSARREIAARGYTIVLNMGDHQSDLAGGYAERIFKVPNPFYYIP
jgi:predicted secreted acid phosphatase